jgi:hypothetical protein
MNYTSFKEQFCDWIHNSGEKSKFLEMWQEQYAGDGFVKCAEYHPIVAWNIYQLQMECATLKDALRESEKSNATFKKQIGDRLEKIEGKPT